MTENEAIEILDKDVPDTSDAWWDALDMAISALKEIQQYRVIGTMEKRREAIEKQKTKKIIIETEYEREFEDYVCPNCKVILQQRMKGATSIVLFKPEYCHVCGQKLDWSKIV